MDPITIVTLVTAVGSLAVSVLTHIKYSTCSVNGCKILSTESDKDKDEPTTPLITPATRLVTPATRLLSKQPTG